MRTLRILGLGAMLFGTGCYPYHRHMRGPDPVDTCLLSACFVNTCLLDSCLNGPRRYEEPPRHHHHHGSQCGCPSRYEYGHTSYWYDGRWESQD